MWPKYEEIDDLGRDRAVQNVTDEVSETLRSPISHNIQVERSYAWLFGTCDEPNAPPRNSVLIGAAKTMEVACLVESADLHALQPTWRSIGERCDDISIFQTSEWQLTWWTHYGTGSPYVLVARVDSEPVAILPLYRSAERLPLGRRLWRIRPIGVGGDTSPDYLGPIALKEHAKTAAAAFLAYLFAHRADWDVLELTDLLESSPLLGQVGEARLPRGCRVHMSEPNRIFYTDLPDSWDQYMSVLSSHARYSVRNVRRKFLARPESKLFHWTESASLDLAIDQLIELHTERWKGRSEHHSFSTSKYNAFHRALMHEFMANGWLRLYCMELSGRLIGVFYGYAFRRILYHFQGGFDPAHEQLRIGQCLMAFAIEEAIGEGCRCLDMLRGEYEYKKRWAPHVRQTFSCRIVRATASSYLNGLLRRFAMPLKSRLIRFFERLAPSAA